MSTIYRGYNVSTCEGRREGEKDAVVVELGSVIKHVCDDFEDAYTWIDAQKKAAAKKGGA